VRLCVKRRRNIQVKDYLHHTGDDKERLDGKIKKGERKSKEGGDRFTSRFTSSSTSSGWRQQGGGAARSRNDGFRQE